MKQVTCSAMGGEPTCDHVITGATAQEMIDNGWKHIMEAHPERGATIQANPKEENDKWMDEFKAKFDTLADAESAPAPEAAPAE